MQASLPAQEDLWAHRASPQVAVRDICNALFNQARTGCQWRLLPEDFPPYNLE
jgi:transposase